MVPSPYPRGARPGRGAAGGGPDGGTRVREVDSTRGMPFADPVGDWTTTQLVLLALAALLVGFSKASIQGVGQVSVAVFAAVTSFFPAAPTPASTLSPPTATRSFPRFSPTANFRAPNQNPRATARSTLSIVSSRPMKIATPRTMFGRGAESRSCSWNRSHAPTDPPLPYTDTGPNPTASKSATTAPQAVSTSQPRPRTASRPHPRLATYSPTHTNQPSTKTTTPPPTASTRAAASWSPAGPSRLSWRVNGR